MASQIDVPVMVPSLLLATIPKQHPIIKSILPIQPITSPLLILTITSFLAQPVVAADAGDDAANNLFSDLAPLLALFGEQFARQFLSESLSNLDTVIFAIAPLGILTAIVGAIRVGGPSWLRAIIGRARENIAAAEIELMSSTSHEVGELWNGQAVVRTLGTPEVREVIFLEEEDDAEVQGRKGGNARGKRTFGLHTLETAEKDGLVIKRGSASMPLRALQASLKNAREQSIIDDEEEDDDEEEGDEGDTETQNDNRIAQKPAPVPVPGPSTPHMPYSHGLADHPFAMGSPHLQAVTSTHQRKESVTSTNSRHRRRRGQNTRNKNPDIGLHAHVVNATDIGISNPSTADLFARSLGIAMGSTVAVQGAIATPANSNGLPESAPNISLNLHGGSKRSELIAVAVIGVVIQLGTLVFAGLTVYHQSFKRKFQKDGEPVEEYALPLYVVGTLALSTAMLICAGVIEKSTAEEKWVVLRSQQQQSEIEVKRAPQDSAPRAHILWLQKSHIVSDQMFDSFVIFAPVPRTAIMSSHRNPDREPGSSTPTQRPVIDNSESRSWPKYKLVKLWWRVCPWPILGLTTLIQNQVRKINTRPVEFWTLVGTLLGIASFILQFQGMRGLNWLVSIAHLVSIAIMTTLRAWIRRGLIVRPIATEALDGHEQDWFALQFAAFRAAGGPRAGFWPSPRTAGGTGSTFKLHTHLISWTIATGYRNIACRGVWHADSDTGNHPIPGVSRRPQEVLQIRQRLRTLTKWTGKASKPSLAAATSIEIVLNTLFRHSEKLMFFWFLTVRIGGVDRRIRLTARRESKNVRWRVDWTEIEAALSLWLFHILSTEAHQRKLDAESAPDSVLSIRDVQLRRDIVRMLGPDTDELRRDLMWWMEGGSSKPFRVSIDDRAPPHEVLIGFTGLESEDDSAATLNAKSPISKPTSPQDAPAPRGFRPPPSPQHALAVMTDAPLEYALAQHILTSFLWAVSTEKIELNDSTYVTNLGTFRVDTIESLNHVKLENRVLVNIAGSIQRTGLGNLHEIYMCLIPPLSHAKKLPMGAVLIAVREAARNFEVHGHWEIIGPVYKEIWRMCNTFGTTNDISWRATAMVLDVLRSVTTNIDQRVIQERDNDNDLNAMLELKRQLVHALQSHEQAAVLNFICLYGLGQRIHCFAWDCLKPSQGDKNALDKVHKYFHHALVFSEIMSVYPWRLKDLISSENALKRDTLGRTPLHYAAVLGNVQVIRSLSRAGVDPRAMDVADWTPLHYAVESMHVGDDQTHHCKEGEFEQTHADHASVLWTLLQIGSDMEMRSRDGQGVLHVAARNGNAHVAGLLLQAGANVEIQDNLRMTPLHYAAHHAPVEVVDCLLKKRANVAARDGYGRTALHIAALKGNADIVELLLLDEEIETDAKGRDGRTALHLAAGSGNKLVVELLLGSKQGVDIGARDNNRHTALHHAARGGNVDIVALLLNQVRAFDNQIAKDHDGRTALHLSANRGHLGVVKLILNSARSIDLEIRDNEGRTALHLAVIGGHTAIARFLLDSGADKEARDNDDQSPLHMAAGSGHDAIVKMLIAEFNVVVDARRKFADNTALHFAADNGHESTVRLLLNYGADFNTRHYSGSTALYRAAAHGHPASVLVLLEYGKDSAGWTDLHVAAATNDERKVKQLLEAGAEVDARDYDGWTALHLAASSGYEGVAGHLIDHGASLEAEHKDGYMALHFAAERSREGMVKFLLQRGASVGSYDEGRWTALHWAAWNGNDDMMRLLLAHGAKVDVVEKEQQTPLHWAAWKGHETSVKILLDHNADVDAQDVNGWTSLHWAAWKGHESTAEVLLDRGANIESVDKDGKTALYLAGSNGYEAMVRLLIDREANIHVPMAPQSRGTLLHWMAASGHDAMVRLLASRGAQLEATDDHGCTALHRAVLARHDPTVRALLAYGANIKAVDDRGWTPLYISARIGDEITLKTLLGSEQTRPFRNLGTVLNVVCGKNGTALHAAILSGKSEIVGYLLQFGANSHVGDGYGWTATLCGTHSPRVAIRELFADTTEDSEQDAQLQGPTCWTLICDYSNAQTVHGEVEHISGSQRSNAPKQLSPHLLMQANHPINPHKPIYFEITLDFLPTESQPVTFALGFSNGPLPPVFTNSAMEYRETIAALSISQVPHTIWWGYYKEPSPVEQNSVTNSTPEESNLTFSAGDVIGCGISTTTSGLFFTKNGVKLPDVLFEDELVSGQLFPVLAIIDITSATAAPVPADVKGNFGPEFVYREADI